MLEVGRCRMSSERLQAPTKNFLTSLKMSQIAQLMSIVSKKTKRFQRDGFNLDLTCKSEDYVFFVFFLLLVSCSTFPTVFFWSMIKFQNRPNRQFHCHELSIREIFLAFTQSVERSWKVIDCLIRFCIFFFSNETSWNIQVFRRCTSRQIPRLQFVSVNTVGFISVLIVFVFFFDSVAEAPYTSKSPLFGGECKIAKHSKQGRWHAIKIYLQIFPALNFGFFFFEQQGRFCLSMKGTHHPSNKFWISFLMQ